MKLTTIEVKGKKFEVNVSDQGKFSFHDDGQEFTASSLDDLKEIANKHLRRKATKVSIPVAFWEKGFSFMAGSIICGEITGIHGSNGNFLLKGKNGRTEQVHNYSHYFVPPEKAKEYETLQIAAFEAQRAVSKFEKDNALNIKELVEAAYNKAEENRS